MPRAKRGFKRRRRVNKLKDEAEGFVMGRRTQFRRMAEAVRRSHCYAYTGRRLKKRDFRSLWVSRLSAASAQSDLSYSRFICALKKSDVTLDRKVLSSIAIEDPAGFAAIVNEVRNQAPAN